MHRRNEPAAFLTLLVIGLLAAQLAILAMAVCPSLQMWLHHDADLRYATVLAMPSLGYFQHFL